MLVVIVRSWWSCSFWAIWTRVRSIDPCKWLCTMQMWTRIFLIRLNPWNNLIFSYDIVFIWFVVELSVLRWLAFSKIWALLILWLITKTGEDRYVFGGWSVNSVLVALRYNLWCYKHKSIFLTSNYWILIESNSVKQYGIIPFREFVTAWRDSASSEWQSIVELIAPSYLSEIDRNEINIARSTLITVWISWFDTKAVYGIGFDWYKHEK